MTKLGYLLRETGTNFLRNFTMSVAAIITVALSVALAGSAWVRGESAGKATAQVDGGVEFIIFLDPSIPDDQRDAIETELEVNPGVSDYEFFTKDDAFEEFQTLFADQQSLLDAVEPDVLPESFKVVPTDPDAAVVSSLVDNFDSRAGVQEVVFNFDDLKRIQALTSKATRWLYTLAIAALAVAVILVLNTSLMAMRSRRQDIEVMRLVGATNSYIRIPFMVEGLIQGLFGAAIGVGLVLGANWWIRSDIEPNTIDTLVAKLVGAGVDNSELLWLSIGLALIGTIVGFLSSGLAVSVYLKD